LSSYQTEYTVVRDQNVVVKINDVTLNKPVSFEFFHGNEIVSDPYIGTDILGRYTSKLDGGIILDFPYSTDLDLDTLCKPGANGQVPTTEVTITLTDTQTPTKTDSWTLQVMFWQPRIAIGQRDPTVRAQLIGVFADRPQRIQI